MPISRAPRRSENRKRIVAAESCRGANALEQLRAVCAGGNADYVLSISGVGNVDYTVSVRGARALLHESPNGLLS